MTEEKKKRGRGRPKRTEGRVKIHFWMRPEAVSRFYQYREVCNKVLARRIGRTIYIHDVVDYLLKYFPPEKLKRELETHETGKEEVKIDTNKLLDNNNEVPI